MRVCVEFLAAVGVHMFREQECGRVAVAVSEAFGPVGPYEHRASLHRRELPKITVLGSSTYCRSGVLRRNRLPDRPRFSL
jgi:hypothetical protein